MGEHYNPLQHSVVQAITGTWCEYECDDFVEALLMALLEEIKRVHWNVYQHQWGASWHGDEVEDPEIPGIGFTRYYDGCDCEDGHEPTCRHSRPNFQYEDVQFRWYKYPGRGMSTNKAWEADEWREWFGRCLGAIRAFDKSHLNEMDDLRCQALHTSLKERFPQAFEHVTSAQDKAFYGAMFGAFERLHDAETPCWQCSEDGFGAGGGMFEGGEFGTVARTLHEDDDPNGACKNCGHVNTEEQAKKLDERRRKNSDAMRGRWQAQEESPETKACYANLRTLTLDHLLELYGRKDDESTKKNILAVLADQKGQRNS